MSELIKDHRQIRATYARDVSEVAGGSRSYISVANKAATNQTIFEYMVIIQSDYGEYAFGRVIQSHLGYTIMRQKEHWWRKHMEEELIIPVYLNQRIVFDMIAMLQDGMSTVTRITSSEADKNLDNQKYGTSFGLSQALSSLLKIDVSGERSKSKEGTSETQRSEERVHTPASLFQKLRSILRTKNKLKATEHNYSPKPGDMIEFSTSLRKNPIIHAMDTFSRLIDMASVFENPQQKSGNKKQHSNDTSRIKSQLEKFTEGLRSGGTIDIVSDSSDWKYKAVITLEEEYLNDPSMSDLVDGQFQVVGKIIRVIDNSTNAVSLLRKASIGSMNKELLEKAFSELAAAAALGNLDMPKIELEIKGPVIQIIPIAIFA